ncbi:MAG: hypothetical protein RL168_902 [Bacteroidota bacterium]
MIWAVELGNTRTKVTRMDLHGARVGETLHYAPEDFTWVAQLDQTFPIRVANTANRPLPEALKGHVVQLQSPWPFAMQCAPTLGIDRCLSVLGARQIHPNGPLAVISCGTCLTGTLLDGDDVLCGGPIAPGWTMRLNAMAHYAPALPAVQPVVRPFEPRGTLSTEASMQQGAYTGMEAEISHWIAAWQEEFPGIAIFITGGDGPTFAKPSESGIFAASNLEARGLLAQYVYETHP